MKDLFTILFFVALIITTGCNNCADNDCGEDDVVLIVVDSDDQVNYVDSIDFYYYDANQLKIKADIRPRGNSLRYYYAYLDYRQLAPQQRYYLAVGDQSKTVDITTRYDQDECCGDYLRFDKILVDGDPVSFAIEVSAN